MVGTALVDRPRPSLLTKLEILELHSRYRLVLFCILGHEDMKLIEHTGFIIWNHKTVTPLLPYRVRVLMKKVVVLDLGVEWWTKPAKEPLDYSAGCGVDRVHKKLIVVQFVTM